MKIIKNKRFKKLLIQSIIFFSILFGCFRIYNLDADTPDFGVSHYMPIDEGSYSLMALNQYNYATVNTQSSDLEVKPYVSEQLRNNIVGNVLTYSTLLMFGDNYYGLRMSNVIIFGIALLLLADVLYLIYRNYTEDKDFKNILILCLIILMQTTDFVNMMSSRIQETSLLRMVFVYILIIVYEKLKRKGFQKFFLLGFLSTFSIFFVYITNVFLLMAVGLIFLFEFDRNDIKNFLKKMYGLILGVMVGLALAEVYYNVVWNTGAISNMMTTIMQFAKPIGNSNQSAYSYSMFPGIRELAKRILRFVSSDTNLYNLPILFFTLTSLPVIFLLQQKKKDNTIVFAILIYFSMLIQTCVSEDYILRKYIIISGIPLILLYYVWISRSEIKELLHNKKQQLLQLIWTSLSLFTVLFVCYYRVKRISDGSLIDLTTSSKYIITFSLLLYLILVLLIILILKKNKYLFITIMTICFTIGINVYFDFSVIFLNPSFSEKQVMIDLQKDYKNEYLVGEYECGFTLYNDIKFVPTSSYESRIEYLEKYDNVYAFDYYFNDDEIDNYFYNFLGLSQDYGVKTISIYQRNYAVFGNQRSVAVYKIYKKQ